MMVHEITQAVGAHKRRKRVGRGESSGHGKTSGRGNKGMQARSGGGPHPMHEGGAIPLYRRLPKRGFSNFAFRRAYAPVNLDDLERYCQSGDKVDPAAIRSHGLNGHDLPIKILGNGQLTKKLHVTAHAVSGAAKAAIEQAGGSVTVIEARDAKALWKAKRGKMKNQKRPAAGPTRIEKKKQSAARAR